MLLLMLNVSRKMYSLLKSENKGNTHNVRGYTIGCKETKLFGNFFRRDTPRSLIEFCRKIAKTWVHFESTNSY